MPEVKETAVYTSCTKYPGTMASFSCDSLGPNTHLKFSPSLLLLQETPFLCGFPSGPLGLKLNLQQTTSLQTPTQHKVCPHIFITEPNQNFPLLVSASPYSPSTSQYFSVLAVISPVIAIKHFPLNLPEVGRHTMCTPVETYTDREASRVLSV